MKQASRIKGVGESRSLYDFYSTPVYVTDSLLDFETFQGSILEPACGSGAISEILLEEGYTVISKDLMDRGYGQPNKNFMFETEQYDNVITNPPYFLAEGFIFKAKKIAKNKIALLLRINFLAGKKRYKMFQDPLFPFKCVYVFAGRVNFDGGKSGSMIDFSWFVWDREWKGEPVIRWINK